MNFDPHPLHLRFKSKVRFSENFDNLAMGYICKKFEKKSTTGKKLSTFILYQEKK